MHAHRYVAKLAEDMAQEAYERRAKDNAWRALHLDRRAWVKENAPFLVHHARSVLAKMLGDPWRNEDDKEFIAQALLDDVTIPRGGKSFVQ